MNVFVLISGLVGYFTFELLEARKRATAVGSNKSVADELMAMWPILLAFGVLAMGFSGFIVEGATSESWWSFSFDRLVRGGASGFALIPILTRFRSTLPDRSVETIRRLPAKASIFDLTKEYLRQRT